MNFKNLYVCIKTKSTDLTKEFILKYTFLTIHTNRYGINNSFISF